MENIVFDNVLFPRAKSLTLLLYDINGVALYIDLPNANRMSFVNFFQKKATCHDHILANHQKEITLFVYEENIRWLIENLYFNQLLQIEKINIYCSSEESQQWWAEHTRRYRNKIQVPFLHHKLDFQLLLFGYKYLMDLLDQFPGKTAIQNRLKEDRRIISEVLGRYFLSEANSLNDDD